MKEYYEMETVFDSNDYEHICNILYLNGITTLLEENGIIKIYFDAERLTFAKHIRTELLKLPSLRSILVSLTRLKGHDWHKDWKNSIEPIYIQDRIIIFPSWKKKEFKNVQDRILIELDPRMSFGTGQSETTQMMLEMLCSVIHKKDRKMLDFGCGTGILSIAGIKLGLKKVTAIDIDADAIQNAREYIGINSVKKYIKVYKCDIIDVEENDFDIITANIELNVIKEKLPAIYERTRNDGKILLSGIRSDEENKIKRALKKNRFLIKEIISKGEWLCIYAVKK